MGIRGAFRMAIHLAMDMELTLGFAFGSKKARGWREKA
jgi:hypothetical protein